MKSNSGDMAVPVPEIVNPTITDYGYPHGKVKTAKCGICKVKHIPLDNLYPITEIGLIGVIKGNICQTCIDNINRNENYGSPYVLVQHTSFTLNRKER